METAATMKCSIATSVEVGKTLGDMREVKIVDGEVYVLKSKQEDGTKIWDKPEVYNVIKEGSLQHAVNN